MPANQKPSSNQKKEDYSGLIIALIIAFFIILYVLSLGNLKASKLKSRHKELNESLEKAKARHQKLLALIDKKQELKQKLANRFKRIYLRVRIVLVAGWAGTLFSLYAFGFVKDLGDVLNYSEAFILLIVTFNFLTFGTLTNLNHFLDVIKLRFQNWVYGKYVNIKEIIAIDRNKLDETQQGIETIHNEIKAVNELQKRIN